MAQTPDGETPAYEDECDSLDGAAYGLCNAFCEAKDCDEAAEETGHQSCDRLKEKFTELTQEEYFPCEEYCGDGVLDEGEDCDDGNNNEYDGCDSYCEVTCPCTDSIYNNYNGLSIEDMIQDHVEYVPISGQELMYNTCSDNPGTNFDYAQYLQYVTPTSIPYSSYVELYMHYPSPAVCDFARVEETNVIIYVSQDLTNAQTIACESDIFDIQFTDPLGACGD
jgi:cysteine-rich repeat protein